MRKFFHVFSIFALQLFPQAAWGIQAVGNGGEVTVCETEAGQESVELSDFVTPQHWPTEFFSKNFHREVLGKRLLVRGNDSVVMAVSLLEQIGIFDLALKQALVLKAEAFLRDARFVRHTLPKLNDARKQVVPKGCRLEQAVIQRPHRVKGDPFFIVNQLLWDLLSVRQKADLIVHEILVEELARTGHYWIDSARDWVVALSTGAFRKMSQTMYDQMKIRLVSDEQNLARDWFICLRAGHGVLFVDPNPSEPETCEPTHGMTDSFFDLDGNEFFLNRQAAWIPLAP